MANILVSTKDLSREEWLAWRNKGIGGSDVSVICGINKYKSAVELWMEKTGQIQPKESGEAAYWGTILEPLVREEFIKRSGLKVNIVKSILKHPTHDFMLANLDGIVKDSFSKDCIFEAKTASAYKQEQWLNGIPEEYMLQVQHYMAVTGYEKSYVAALIGGNTFIYHEIARDDELIDMIIKLEEHFWNCVTTNTPPSLDGSKASTELLNRLYPISNSNHQIILPDEARDLIMQYDISKEQEKQATEMKEEAANKLRALLGKNEAGVIDDRTVIWKSISTRKFDSKALQQNMPDIYDKYLVLSSSRRLTIK
jgi:putative phage-type endonuclease